MLRCIPALVTEKGTDAGIVILKELKYEPGSNSRETECRQIHPVQPPGRYEAGDRG